MITVYTDASHYLDDKVAGWACVVWVGNKKFTQKNGVVKSEVFDSTSAELMAIANSIAVLKNCGFKTDEKHKVMIFSDSLNAIRRLSGKTSKGAVKSNPKLTELTAKILTTFPSMWDISFHKVKAHTGARDHHSINNHLADKLAKDALRA